MWKMQIAQVMHAMRSEPLATMFNIFFVGGDAKNRSSPTTQTPATYRVLYRRVKHQLDVCIHLTRPVTSLLDKI